MAWGDSKKLYRPQIVLAGQYSLFAKFNNYQVYFPLNPATGKSVFQYNNAGIGIQMSWPIFDRALKDRAAESAADAAHAFAEYDNARIKDQEGHAQLARSTRTLAAKAEVADLAAATGLRSSSPRSAPSFRPAPPTLTSRSATPRTRRNAEIDERGKYVSMLNSRFDLQQAQVQLMRAQGNLDGMASCRRRIARNGSSTEPITRCCHCLSSSSRKGNLSLHPCVECALFAVTKW